ncbi:MAG TPA: DUF5915 domain-containing protein, partial [Mycobacteriales bacterium]|nr:DUF5915 domain-containing protein [Mycobacteriales bacterium]
WYLMASPILRGGDLSVTEQGIRDAARQVMLPLWNAWYFFALYANADGYEAKWRTDSPHVLDRYVLAKLHDLIEGVTVRLDDYDVAGACAEVRSFLDVLTNWYIRRSRDRFWSANPDAFDTLYTVLEALNRVAAPLLPMETEQIYRGLTGARSVHLTDWPAVAEFPADADLVSTMDIAREVTTAALRVRKSEGLRVRQPLATLTVAAAGAEALERFRDLLADEVNVKQIDFSSDVDALCRRVLQVNPRALGPRLGKDVQRVIKAVRAGDWSIDGGSVVAGGVALQDGEYTLKLEPAAGQAATTLDTTDGVVVLDTQITPELAAEGLARDVVRAVQNARKEAGFDVADRISLQVAGTPAVLDAVRTHSDFIAAETLAGGVDIRDALPDADDVALGSGESVRVQVARA